MNETNIKANIETGAGELKSPVYSSKFLMSKDLYYDFSSVSYNKIKKIFFVFLCLDIFVVFINLWVGNYDIVLWYGPFMLFVTLLMYFRLKRTINIIYERNLLSVGKESTMNYEFFEDKIVSHTDELKRDYFYHQITGLCETKKFIMLHLQYNLYIPVQKNSLNASVDEVKSFFIEKCTHVKKKKFIDCGNDPRWSFLFLIAIVVVSVIGTIVGLLMKINAII